MNAAIAVGSICGIGCTGIGCMDMAKGIGFMGVCITGKLGKTWGYTTLEGKGKCVGELLGMKGFGLVEGVEGT